MGAILLIIFVVLLVMFPVFRCVVTHPVSVVRYGVLDLFQYLQRKKGNLCPTGELVAYVGLFGRGKTLSAVHKVVSAYERYDGLTVWCDRRKKFVIQRVKVLSNVALQIPYEDLISLEQVVLCAERNRAEDEIGRAHV